MATIVFAALAILTFGALIGFGVAAFCGMAKGTKLDQARSDADQMTYLREHRINKLRRELEKAGVRKREDNHAS